MCHTPLVDPETNNYASTAFTGSLNHSSRIGVLDEQKFDDLFGKF